MSIEDKMKKRISRRTETRPVNLDNWEKVEATELNIGDRVLAPITWHGNVSQRDCTVVNLCPLQLQDNTYRNTYYLSHQVGQGEILRAPKPPEVQG